VAAPSLLAAYEDTVGELPENVGGGVPPKTLTLFMIKICNFLYPIYDLTKTFIPCQEKTLFMT